ncbi:NifB/NifX family molybdenum-iron cluster-binding protein [Intestinimonas sp. MSJ-38]|uniref:NifB/NifX family molybdenum-iron cluster-binding protein n=1 Tax=Intestinimonas sp. MSJ-38 TaxID=2841532 RepID=UPI001C1171E1|nr:NifB/NifX family molybdenum-iron cluster-binding protein [Intestinimonas sp. MSJ-38]MBU5433613.1 dinitrogenase iron-molybdenum cofactor biosynthesis protein [Intestinimonas sp. MSJ-38]
MKIAVTYENGQVFQHFGKTQQFKMYQVESGQADKGTVVDAGGAGHSALAVFLKEHQVETLICGGIGGGAQAALAQAGIQVYPGIQGDADQAAQAFAKGELKQNTQATCNHHHEGEHHHCGHNEQGGCGHHCEK